MRARYSSKLSGVLVVSCIVLLSPSPLSAINTCATICNCIVACNTVCLWGQFVDGVFVVYADSCEEYGVCLGAAVCTGPAGCPARGCTSVVFGSSGNDTINGGSARECIIGFAGNDTIDGGAGDDIVVGGDGGDVVYGNSGNDCLYGEAGADLLYGDSGYDLGDGGIDSDPDGCMTELMQYCW